MIIMIMIISNIRIVISRDEIVENISKMFKITRSQKLINRGITNFKDIILRSVDTKQFQLYGPLKIINKKRMSKKKFGVDKWISTGNKRKG